ncbi:hypothetical protein SAMN05518847_110159 [Paenibacillus sp. OV219]|nr:hypothetical protein SAMN05518847_110159 [Paenibacillus sp. OV219]
MKHFNNKEMNLWVDLVVLQDLRDQKDPEGPEDQQDLQQKEPNYFKDLLEQSEKLDLLGLQERLDLQD